VLIFFIIAWRFFNSHDSEFRVASLPYMLEFKVMPEGCDGINEDVDDGHYDIHKMEDEMLYREFVEKLQQKESNYVFFLIDTKVIFSLLFVISFLAIYICLIVVYLNQFFYLILIQISFRGLGKVTFFTYAESVFSHQQFNAQCKIFSYFITVESTSVVESM